jgi:hypothetical protein
MSASSESGEPRSFDVISAPSRRTSHLIIFENDPFQTGFDELRVEHGGRRLALFKSSHATEQWVYGASARRIGDFDGDGWDDVLVIGSADIDGRRLLSLGYGSEQGLSKRNYARLPGIERIHNAYGLARNYGP